MSAKKNYIDGQWLPGEGNSFDSIDPSTGAVIENLRSATIEQTNEAVTAARTSFSDWSRTSIKEREDLLRCYAENLEKESQSIAELISREIGKPPWESSTEVGAMIGKIAISIDAFEARCGEFRGGPAVTRFRPHGVVGVLSPYNFPGHLVNGHLVPALLAGNTAVLKPSEHAPLTAARIVEIWMESDLPAGVLNLVQGAAETGRALVENPDIDGVFFTGSARVGQLLRKSFADRPGKILALEMGGNNPLLLEQVAPREAALLLVIQSAFLTAGQRCTCARRLTVPEGKWGDEFLGELTAMTERIVVGPPDHDPEPFMGPVVSEAIAGEILASQDALLARGARSLCESRLLKTGTGLLRPGILDVTAVDEREDEEIFGPLLQVIRVPDLDAALKEANRTAYGLAAGLISDDPASWKRCRDEIRCGVMNWNQPTTGASSAAPFGGTGRSGNFRPSAYFAADYCSWPVASIEVEKLAIPEKLPPGLEG